MQTDASLRKKRHGTQTLDVDGCAPALQHDERRVVADATAGLVPLEDQPVDIQVHAAPRLLQCHRLEQDADPPAPEHCDPFGQFGMQTAREENLSTTRGVLQQARQQRTTDRPELDAEPVRSEAREPVESVARGR